MNNIFNSCKTIGDLYNVFAYNPDLTFETATDAELNRLADVFEANVAPADMVDTPLGETEFNHIRNFVITKVNGVIEDIETEMPETEENNNKEEKVMAGTVKENINLAVEEMVGKFTSAKENIKVGAGETREEYFEKVDDSLNVVTGAFGTALSVLDNFFGFTSLKADILDIYHAGERANGKKDIFKMAKKCRERVDAEIEEINELSDLGLMDEEEAVKLKDVLEELKGSNIFKKFAVTLTFFVKKIARKLRKWFQVDEEKSVVGAICRSVAGVAEVIKAGLKIVWDTAKFAVSFIVAGIMLVAAPIIRAIKSLVEKIKDWVNKKLNKAKETEEEEDEEFFEIEEEIEDDLEEEFAE